jgi:isopenicillin N synthase-like dioxygenase
MAWHDASEAASSEQLSEDGITQLHLSEDESCVIKDAFECASRAMDNINKDISCFPHLIEPNHDAYHCTGYHPLGGSLSSKYNKYREGFIFSNGDLFDIQNDAEGLNFESTMEKTRKVLHSLAVKAIKYIETTIGLESDYMEKKYGLSTAIIQHSQWHLKRYASEVDNDDTLALGVHTDPSIVSVVIHDAPQVQSGGWGLQYSTKKIIDKGEDEITITSQWNEVSFHGHSVATIMVGAAFARISQVGENINRHPKITQLRKMYPPCRHRVVPSSSSSRRRMALTYFLRPDPSSILEPLPIFTEMGVKSPKKHLAFGAWYDRVSSRYKKSKSKK